MKKISSKIIVCIILVTLFWGGFGFVSNGTKTAFSINKAQASIADEKCGNTAPNSDVNSPAYTQWRTCRADATKAQAPIDNGYLAFLKDVGTNALAYLGEGAVRAATAVIGGVLQLIVIPVLGMLLRIVAACLDLAIKFTLDSGHISAVSDAINSVWTIVRNIFNITFIFILLWAAIQTIVGVAGANTKKIIADVVIAALLINFSLLITRIIIDAGNIIAVALYNLITSNDSITISTIIANNLQLGTLYATTGTTGSVFSTPFFIISALQFITILTAIITLGYAALLFLVRNVMLIFLMALSPVGFMGNVLPKVDEYSKMWRKNLYGMVFMAPIFLLLFYLIVKIGDGLTLSGSAAGINTDYTAYFKYMMIIILLIAATKMTKSMSGVAGEFTEKMGTLAAGAAIGVATGGLALAGRATLGRAASHIAQSETLTNAASKGGLGGIASRMALKSAVGTSKASFDARNTGGFKSATNMIGSQTGLKIDYNRGMKTQKDGYVGMADRQEKRELDTAMLPAFGVRTFSGWFICS